MPLRLLPRRPVSAPSGTPPKPWTRRLPLRCTLLATAALLALPTALLVRLPRPRAEGMGRLLPHAAMLLSCPGAPERSAPQLWQQRLPGALADQFWRQQRQLWWQLWAQEQLQQGLLAGVGQPAPAPHDALIA
ncbi:MAG: hypothetical protein ACKOPS_12205, partial [Cyanobium sp.]